MMFFVVEDEYGFFWYVKENNVIWFVKLFEFKKKI